jgi:hypothetical protein
MKLLSNCRDAPVAEQRFGNGCCGRFTGWKVELDA